jgi:LuxR family maltose regulon positive regulatory protein
LAWQLRGEQAAAVSTLARAVRLAEPGGYIRIFADLGQQIDGLLAQLAVQGVAPLLVAAIRDAIEPAVPQPLSAQYIQVPHTPVDALAADGEPSLASLLTYREQDVLRLLGRRLTNQEIAAALSISPQTVKRHTANIFRKLKINNRRAASTAASRLNAAYPRIGEL